MSTTDGLQVSLVVEPFEIGDSVPPGWNAAGFADSLVTQLSSIRGIHAATHSSSARYVLRGNVMMKEGRLILATRLARDGTRDTVWTATFWRSLTSNSTLLSDLAAAVAEAALNETVRESLTPRTGKP